MSNTTTVPNNAKFDVVTFDIIADGQAIDPAIEVMSISIIKEVNKIPSAKIVIRDGDPAKGTFVESQKDTFLPGKKIQIKIGLDRKNTTLFKGIIIRHSIKITQDGTANLFIECKDESVRLTIGRRNQYYEESKDSEIIDTIIGRYSGISKDVETTSLKHREMVQHHCTDWDFILSRAEVNGRIIVVDDGKITVSKPDTKAEPAIRLAYGASLLEFEAEMDARTQWASVEAKSWDYSAQSLFNISSDSAKVTEPGNVSGSTLAEVINLPKFEIRHSGHVIEEELKEWADATMLKSRLAKICGRAKFTGFPDVKPGQTVDFQGLGSRFNGKAFVSAVRHDVAGGDWDTQVQLGMQPEWFSQSSDIMDTASAGLLPGIEGLQIGKVVQLQNDPEGEDRILVRLPIIDAAAQGIWCRVACLDAGSNRGSFFRPEIDDEVIVGFVNCDPRDAVVLGMLNSSAKPAPISAQDVNHEKGFTTREGMRIHFHDQTKTITIDTPAGNVIKLDEASTSISITDQNGNKMKMSPTGIDLESAFNINIKAGVNLSLSAGAALSISAAQLSVSATGPLELSGGTAKLSGSGIAEISGGLVKIN